METTMQQPTQPTQPTYSYSGKYYSPQRTDEAKEKKPKKNNGRIGTRIERLKYPEFLSIIKDDNQEKIILDLITERNQLTKRISDLKTVNEALEREFTEYKTGLFTKRLENMEIEYN